MPFPAFKKMVRIAQIIELPGPDAFLSLALRFRTQGNLVDAAFWAATAAQTSGGAAFFEANALAAAISAQTGQTESAIEYWDRIVRSAPHKLNWLEAAIRFALVRPEAAEALERWQKLLLNVYISTPSAAFLALLTAHGFCCTGSVGLHSGRIKGWIWLEKGQQTSLGCEGVKNFRLVLQPKAASSTHALYEIDEPAPHDACVIAIRDGYGRHIQGSPLVCSPAYLKHGKKDSSLTVIIPVYDDYRATMGCLGSVFASLKYNKSRPDVLVAWDNGPDGRLLERLRRLAARGKIILSENGRNLGFLASVNAAIARVARGDVILLNADTIVHGNWVDRLKEAALAPDAATVTALSNEAELLSYPSVSDRGKVRSLRQIAILDRAAAQLPAAEAVVEIPVGVGFCMLITRRVLNQIGALDGRCLFRGYGEEVDFCLRAQEAGFRNYGAFNVFVGHLGERSFGAAKKALAAQNNVAIFERFPKYRLEYELFVLQKHPRKLRERIALASLGGIRSLPVLEIRPWSVRYLPPWVKDEQCKPDRRGAVVFLQPGPRPRALLRIWTEIPVMEIEFDLLQDGCGLQRAVSALRIDKCVAYTAEKSVLDLAVQYGLDFSVAEAPADVLPEWRGEGYRLLASPPQNLASFRKLKFLARSNADKTFFVFHMDSLWKGAPRPENILEMPRVDDFRLLAPDAMLMLDNFADHAAWRYWLDCHKGGKLPIYRGE